MPKTSRIVGAVLVALSLPLSAVDEAGAQEEDSSAVTTIFTSLMQGVAGQVQSVAVGWALSQIGLAGGSSGALNDIADELKAIDQDLQAIDATLVQLLNAIDNQTCVGTETQSSLTKAVDNITTLFTNYQTQFVQPAQAGDPVIPSQLNAWMTAVLDQANGIAANLTAIHNALYANPSNVILECIQSITQSYVSGQGPQENIVDDRPYYTPIINTLNYYYGVQVQGATVLVEALHLKACQAAAVADPDLHCDFTTASTSTPPSDASDICDEPTGTVKTYCDEATEVVTDPQTATGLYERVLAQLIYAGAPYSNDELGLMWGGSIVFARSLEDFTTKAYPVGSSGPPPVTCPLPLTSADPCGWTVNFYTLTSPVDPLTYGGYPTSGTKNSIWVFASAPQMLSLLTPYNNESKAGTINSGGTLAQYLQSIGIDPPEAGHGWIVLFDHIGRNGYTDEQTICFMDTSILRKQSKQPFCDGLSGAGGTDALIYAEAPNYDYYVDDPFTQSLDSKIPVFYQAEWHVTTGHWVIPPSWAIYSDPPAATLAASSQFHWPVFDVTGLACSVRSQGYKNPGGQYTMCGSDLQAYIDALLPPPNAATAALAASADVTLDREDRHRNRGAGLAHELVSFDGHHSNELVVRFDAQAIERFLEGGEPGVATLRLTVDDGASDWDAWHQALTVRPLPGPFVEGNGDGAALDRGTGTGATWYCAEDADIGDSTRDCELYWQRFRGKGARSGGARQLEPEVVVDDDGRTVVRMSWDVTEYVVAGFDAWILRKKRNRDGAHLTFHSREGAADLRDPTLAPTLLLER
jgi:hypothetical protein